MNDDWRTVCIRPTSCCVSFHHQFRVLIMQLFMDDLTMEEIEKFFFVYDLPARLKDTSGKLRSEVLTFVEHQGMMEQWVSEPGTLQQLLRDLGRANLAAKVEEFMRKCLQLIMQ